VKWQAGFCFDGGEYSNYATRELVLLVNQNIHVLMSHNSYKGCFEKFVDWPYYSESELGKRYTFQRFTHFCRPFAAIFRRLVEQVVFTP
jgi:hypothetical protein